MYSSIFRIIFVPQIFHATLAHSPSLASFRSSTFCSLQPQKCPNLFYIFPFSLLICFLMWMSRGESIVELAFPPFTLWPQIFSTKNVPLRSFCSHQNYTIKTSIKIFECQIKFIFASTIKWNVPKFGHPIRKLPIPISLHLAHQFVLNAVAPILAFFIFTPILGILPFPLPYMAKIGWTETQK